ncbi:MAG: UDP-2,3-diacylglucosamine diphosphatase [Pseudomonadales bacterium]|nr:UDP-2,3-diacylglucosamine diphosphatase [Pseudomonadales bacterium]
MMSAIGGKQALFISDLHLDPETPELLAEFLLFLETRAAGAQALYILGDLFEKWIGDDDEHSLGNQVAEALRKLADTGTEIYLMHGNRDFLIGEQYARKCHATLLQEPHIMERHGQRAVLIHGDSLCTRDLAYMQFRQMVRSSRWQQDFLGKSLVERQMIAQQARQQSQEANSNKASDIMDVTPQEVIKLLQEQQVNTLIHGHTHRPAVHTLRLEKPINGSLEAQRLVLGSWDQKGWVLALDESGFNLQHFRFQASPNSPNFSPKAK